LSRAGLIFVSFGFFLKIVFLQCDNGIATTTSANGVSRVIITELQKKEARLLLLNHPLANPEKLNLLVQEDDKSRICAEASVIVPASQAVAQDREVVFVVDRSGSMSGKRIERFGCFPFFYFSSNSSFFQKHQERPSTLHPIVAIDVEIQHLFFWQQFQPAVPC
jgi:hypothetical protein